MFTQLRFLQLHAVTGVKKCFENGVQSRTPHKNVGVRFEIWTYKFFFI